MAIPDYQTLMLPVLKLAAGGERRVPEVAEQVAGQFDLTQEEREQLLPSGRQRLLHNRVHWAKFYMAKAGLVLSPRRGWFTATDDGRALLARNPVRIDVKTLLTIPSFAEFYQTNEASGGAPGGSQTAQSPGSAAQVTPEEQIEAAHVALQSALRDDLLQRIWQNTPGFFEQVIVDLLVAMGYGGSHRTAATQLGRSGDGGVDGVINEDRLGLDRVYVQAKRYAAGNTVGPQKSKDLLVALSVSERVKAFSSQPQPSARRRSNSRGTSLSE